MRVRFEILQGRIETLALDAVVNAANRELVPGTGVDGALRHAAGPELTAHTKTIAPIPHGGALISPGFALPARHVIHTAAPIWTLPGAEAEKVSALANCYRACIHVAAKHALASIAFPCLGTGNFGWPHELARDVALAAVSAALEDAPTIGHVVYCCYGQTDYALYQAALA